MAVVKSWCIHKVQALCEHTGQLGAGIHRISAPPEARLVTLVEYKEHFTLPSGRSLQFSRSRDHVTQTSNHAIIPSSSKNVLRLVISFHNLFVRLFPAPNPGSSPTMCSRVHVSLSPRAYTCLAVVTSRHLSSGSTRLHWNRMCSIVSSCLRHSLQ